MITLNQSMEIEQNYVIRILIALLFTLKLNFIIYIISNDVEKWFDTSNYDDNDKRPLPIGMNKHELGGKIITEFVALRSQTYSYLDDDGNNQKLVIKKSV